MVFKVPICFSVFLCQVQGEERAGERTVDRKGLEGHGWDYSPCKDPMLCPDMPTSLQCIFSDNTGSRTVMKHEMFSHTCWKTVKCSTSRSLLGRGYGLAVCYFSPENSCCRFSGCVPVTLMLSAIHFGIAVYNKIEKVPAAIILLRCVCESRS